MKIQDDAARRDRPDADPVQDRIATALKVQVCGSGRKNSAAPRSKSDAAVSGDGVRPSIGRPIQRDRTVNTLTCHDMASSAATPLDQQHLFALASMHMRSILLDHARAKLAQKRGGGALQIDLAPLDDIAAAANSVGPSSAQPAVDFLALEQAIAQLEQQDPRTAQMLCLHYFGGLDQANIAEQLALSLTSVERGLRFARAYLKQALS